MTRSSRVICGHDATGTLYEISGSYGYDPADSVAVDKALKHLAEALNAEPSPLEAVIAALTPADVTALMQRATQEGRNHTLRALGIPSRAPRNIGETLCRDMLARFRHVHLHDAAHASVSLTAYHRTGMWGATMAWASHEKPEMVDSLGFSRDKGFSPAALGLALWAAVESSAADARLLAWAAEQSWWTAVTPEGRGEPIAAAAHAVIDASPEFVFVDAAPQPDAAGDEAASAPSDDTDGADGAEAGSSPVVPSPADTLEAARQSRARLEDSLALAKAAAEHIDAALTARGVPADEDLKSVAEYCDAFDDAVSALTAAHVGADADDLAAGGIAALDEAITALECLADTDRDGKRLALLASLVPAVPSPALSAHLAELARTVPQAADSPALTASLLAFADLIELVAAAGPASTDPMQAGALLTAAGAALPPQLAPLLFAAGAGQIVYGTNAPRGGHDTANDDHDRADAGARQGAEPSEAATPALAEPAAREQAAAGTGPVPPAALPAPVVRPLPQLPITPHDPMPVAAAAASGAAAAAVAHLIGEQRFGMAAEIADAAGWSAGRITALRIAALTEVIRGDSGPSATRLCRDLEESGNSEDLASESFTVLIAAPALLRAALLTGAPASGALLIALAPRLEPNLADICEQVGRRAMLRTLTGNALRTVLADVTELETHLEAARRRARERMRPTTLRFKRATDIAQRWLAGDGILGRLLKAAAHDDRSAIEDVAAAVNQLSSPVAVSRAIDELDLYFKGRSGKPIEGAARQDLLALAAECCSLVSAWLDAAAAFAGDAAGRAWATAELTEMRAAVLGRAAAALAVADDLAGRPDVLVAAAAAAAHRSLARTFALLDGSETSSPGEPLPDVVLTGELLKLPGATVDAVSGRVTAPPGVTAADLAAAALLRWPAAFAAKVDAEDYASARYMLDAMVGGALGSGGDAGAQAEQLEEAERRSRKDLAAICEQLQAELRRARLNNEITEEQDGELTGLLSDASREQRIDLDRVRAELAEVAGLLPRYRQDAARRLIEQLNALPQNADSAAEADHIRRLIAGGQLSTAEELLYFLEVGEAVPAHTVADERPYLSAFFPAVPDALPAGITAAVLSAARDGQPVPGCETVSFDRLSAPARADTAEALQAWQEIAVAAVENRSSLDVKAHLLPALRLAGFDFQRGSNVQNLALPKGQDRRFVEITGVSWTGRSPVPQFGSKLNGRLRVLLCWSQPDENLLMSWADQDTSGDAVLVAHFGTMSSATRRALAVRAVRSDAPVAVLDDAALAYLAAAGGRQLHAAMAVLLPFTAVQPYVRNKRGIVAPEMFYGREAERKAVLAAEGTQVIYGGRGLGKSALLRDAKAWFEREPGRVAIHIELTTAEIGLRNQGADAVWDLLLRDLQAAGVVPAARAGRTAGRSHEVVRAGVRDWLAADSRNRLLVLLDESDGFFESDAPQRFMETNRLKDLGQLPGAEGRAKVVFAGLHSVQRFAKVSNNTFKHLAQRPTVIGPLRPQYAYSLIAAPMAALGYVFEDPDLVHRILGYCSYQPFLLQMFGNRLVEHMHAVRAARIAAGEPPFTVTRTDVEAVESNADLRADITSTFSDTLNLDPRYNVIANVLAHHAHERGMDFRLSDVQLRDDCRAYWNAGFEGLDAEAFRAYLQEMVGLGVLAPNNDGVGWHLRSPNVLRMIGPKDRVMAELLTAESETVPSDFIALFTRRLLPDGTAAPLTAEQVTDVLGEHSNQVRLVLGSQATGVHKAAQTLQAVCEGLAGRYDLAETHSRRSYEEALVSGRPGQRRVVLCDLLTVDPKESSCAAALKAAFERRPATPGVTRSVVIISGASQIGFWREALVGGEPDGFGVVSLRRFDRRTLHVWSLETTAFQNDDRQARLLEVTGGWPMLVEQAVQLSAARGSEDAALQALAEHLASPDGAADLVEAAGLTADSAVSAAFGHILDYNDGTATLPDVTAAAEISGHPDPAAAVAVLTALDVFNVDAAGLYQVEPLLARCWMHRRPGAVPR